MTELKSAQYQGNPCKRGHSGIRNKKNRSCVECNNEFSRQRIRTEKVRQQQRDWRKKNPGVQKVWNEKNRERRMLAAAKQRAKKKGLPCTISYKDIFIPEVCPVFNTPLEWDGKRDDVPSLDRLDSELGYVKGNVRVISGRANRLKADMTKADILRLLAYMEECNA